jgi:hypothetical protein
MMQTISNNTPISNNMLTSNNREYLKPDQFCFWLQGLFELCPDLKCLSEAQVKMIRDHLNYVFEGKALPGSISLSISPTSGSSTTYIYSGEVTGNSQDLGLQTVC